MSAIKSLKPISSLTKQTEFIDKVNYIIGIIGKVDDNIEVDIKFIHYIGNLIESLVTKSEGINKLQLLISIIKNYKPEISDKDIEDIGKIIDYMLTIKAIKRIPILRRALSYSKELISKLLPFLPLVLKLGSLI